MKTQSIFNLYTQYVLIIGLLIVFNTIQGGAQVKYSVKSEVGYLKYRFHTVRVDPGPNWKGYNLLGFILTDVRELIYYKEATGKIPDAKKINGIITGIFSGIQ